MTKRDHDLRIHTNARSAFNKKADALVGMIIEQPATGQQQPIGFKADVEPKFALQESDILNLRFVGTVDPLGRETSKSFEWNGKQYEICGPSYIEMVKFVDQVAKVDTVCDTLSRDFIRDNLFDWAEKKFKGSEVTDWIPFLLDSASQVVQNYEVWMPISHLHVQSDIHLGRVTFSNLSKQTLERDILGKFECADLPGEEREKIFQTIRQRYQGLATARIRIWSELAKAIEIARIETEISLKLLTCYHLAWCKGELVSSSVPKGEEYAPMYDVIIFDEKRSLNIKRGVILWPFTWTIDNEYLTYMKSCGLDQIHQLTQKQSNEFQRKAFEFFIGYGGSYISRSVSEKILQLVVALEKFLSPRSDDLTQATIADRLAFSVGTDQSDRRRIVKTTKIVYGWRSRLVHSALEISEEQTLEEFLRDVWRFFELLTRNLDSFSTMEEFFEYLEQRKYA